MQLNCNEFDPGRLVILGADHNGVGLKEILADALRKKGYWPIDIGPYTKDRAVDYVDYARQAAWMIRHDAATKAILMCATGQGMSIVANKVHNVRAAVAHSVDVAGKSREHNDTNVLCLGAFVCTPQSNVEMALAWLEEPFGEFRHVRRVARIEGPGTELVFTNGCFDILHRGHIELLRWSSQLGSRLIVGLDTDASIRELKGKGRPINRFDDRKAVLEGNRFVDQVIPFDNENRHEIIATLKPAVLVKGGEYTAAEVRMRDGIPPDVQVRIFPVVKDAESGETTYSTTNVIDRVQR